MSANINFQPVKSGRAFQVIAEQIKESIFAGDLKPGEKLPTERDLAKVFNVSRVTLRSALLKLEKSGLLDIRPGAGGGFFIRELDATNLNESFNDMLRAGKTTISEVSEARMIIEPQIVQLAAERATAKDIARLEKSIKQLLSRTRSGGPPDLKDLNFHISLAEASHNTVLVIICRSLINILFHSIENIEFSTSDTKRIADQHQSIIDVIRDRNGEEARRLMFEHVNDMGKLFKSESKSR